MKQTRSERASETPPAVLSLDALPDLSVVKLRHPWRWVAATAVSLVALTAIWSMTHNPNFDWPTVGEYLFRPVTLSGVLVTLYLTIVSVVLGLVGGVVVALMRLSDNAILVNVAKFYIWIFRGTPVLVQIIFWGYLGALYPSITLGIPFTDVTIFDARTSDVIGPMLAAILALGLNEVAYAAEIIRGGILSVDDGQKQAAWHRTCNHDTCYRPTPSHARYHSAARQRSHHNAQDNFPCLCDRRARLIDQHAADICTELQSYSAACRCNNLVSGLVLIAQLPTAMAREALWARTS
jgi:His/Glu/Gln/Arg/opine family amino acid ABC transporter permease subunit